MMEIAFLTDIGLIRENNEDNIMVDSDKKIFIIADGMGGHVAGEVASQIAVETAYKVTCENWNSLNLDQDNDFINFLKVAFEEANSEVLRYSSLKNLKGMGTTLLEVIVMANKAIICTIGDSRAYLYREDKLQQITTDHTLANNYLIKGDNPRYIPRFYYSMLTKVIGTHQKVEPDFFTIELMQNDILLIATDGLFGMLDDKEMQSIIIENVDIKNIVSELVENAKAKGGKDNITVALYRH